MGTKMKRNPEVCYTAAKIVINYRNAARYIIIPKETNAANSAIFMRTLPTTMKYMPDPSQYK